MASKRTPDAARVGDLIETRGLRGRPPRQGEIVELLGAAERPHYRVRWDREHESIVYPADGVIVTAAPAARTRGAKR
jgi:uncharacterized protein DUF1918